MHEKIDDLFEWVWDKVPLNSGVVLEYSIYKVEYYLHKIANLFEFDEKYK